MFHKAKFSAGSLVLRFPVPDAYAGGEINIDNNEIVSEGWFDRDNLPPIPSPLSISRALIDWWVEHCNPL